MTRILPADVYDALELSALAYGGIGAGRWVADGGAGFGAGPRDIPWCAMGHANACDESWGEMREAFDSVALYSLTNDTAVAAINKRRRRDWQARVPFADSCAELGVVRGES